MLKSLLRFFAQRSTRAGPEAARAPHLRARPRLEALEKRDLMCSPVYAYSGVAPTGVGSAIYVFGETTPVTDIINDHITVRHITVDGVKHVQIANDCSSKVFPAYLAIGGISFTGFGGDDTFRNDTLFPSIADGGEGNDTLIGGSGQDTLFGAGGDDSLFGNAGIDQLFGEDGDDYLAGGIDGVADHLVGGTGKDRFVRESSLDPVWAGLLPTSRRRNLDNPVDFVAGEDLLV